MPRIGAHAIITDETGYQIEVLDLVATASRARTNDVVIVTTAKIMAKTSLQPDSEEITDIGFFRLDSLPEPMLPEIRQALDLFASKARGQLVTL